MVTFLFQLAGSRILLKRSINLAGQHGCRARSFSAQLQQNDITALQSEALKGISGGNVGRRTKARDGDLFSLQRGRRIDPGLHHKLEGKLIGNSTDEDDVGALYRRSRRRRITVLRNPYRTADNRL